MGRVRRTVATGAVLALLLAGVLTALAGPAVACSCVAQTDIQALAAADAVFIGTLVGFSPLDEFNRTSKWSVHEVFKGTVAPSQPVDTAIDGAACGLETEPGRTYLVFASSATETDMVASFGASLCGGTRRAAVGERPAGFPAPRPPGSASPSSTVAGGPTTTVRGTSTTLKPGPTSSTVATPSTSTSLPPATTLTPTTLASELPSEIAASSPEKVWTVLPILLLLAVAGGLGARWWLRRRQPF